MAYKLTQEQKEGANFIRTLNKQIEQAAKTFGLASEITHNLINIGTQYGLQTISKQSKLGVVQFSSSKKQLDKIINDGTLKSLKSQFYTTKGDIRHVYNVANKKAAYTREMKNKNKKYTYKEYEHIKSLNNQVAEKYDDFITSYIDDESYNEWNRILSNLRNDNITNDDLAKVDELDKNKNVIIGSDIVNQATGKIVGTIRDDTIYDYTQ